MTRFVSDPVTPEAGSGDVGAMSRGEPGLPRAFRTPAVYVVAPLGAASSLFLMFGLPLDTWLRFGIWLVIGLVIYAVYGVRHALAAHQQSASRA